MDRLDEIKNKSIMNIKSGRVMMEAKDRDWLIKTVEELREKVKQTNS